MENGASWVPYLQHQLADVYAKLPGEFPEDPVEAFRRCVYVNPFWEDDLSGLVDLMGADRLLFGSDYPHPEGLADPVSYIDELPDEMGRDDVARIMGGNLRGLLGVA